MKLLFDQNLSFKLCRRLADIFPDSEQVRLLNLEEAADTRIWDFARKSGFTVVTFDSDFAELAAFRGAPPKVIWLRCGNQGTEKIEQLLRKREASILDFISDPEAACLEIY
jgi:predicted nuclease of predicted toxin-antitoxin system